MAFALDPRLAADCENLGDLPLCRVLLARDSRWPWLILVPRRTGLRDLDELADDDRTVAMEEIAAAAAALRARHAPDKLNVASLGNMVPQLHIHVIGRFTGDAAWPGPVWGVGDPVPYAEDDLAAEAAALRVTLFG